MKAFLSDYTFHRKHIMAELLMLWKARWGIEVVHRFIKQNLGFAKFQTLSITTQQNWMNAVLDAFLAVLQVKREMKLKS